MVNLTIKIHVNLRKSSVDHAPEVKVRSHMRGWQTCILHDQYLDQMGESILYGNEETDLIQKIIDINVTKSVDPENEVKLR